MNMYFWSFLKCVCLILPFVDSNKVCMPNLKNIPNLSIFMVFVLAILIPLSCTRLNLRVS